MNDLALTFGERLGDRIQRIIAPFERVGEREFLPGALEILETPPSPIGRTMLWLIVGFFTLAIGWAAFGRVDVQATAQGRIRPVGDIKTIQPLDPGIVRAIRVSDGQRVRAGQILIELDPTQAAADSDRLTVDLMRARLDVARLIALQSGGAFVPPAGAPAAEVARARATLAAQVSERAGLIGDLTGQIAARGAEAAQATAERESLAASLPLVRQREAVRRELTERGFGNRLQLIDAQQQLSEAEHQTDVLRARGAQAAASRAALERQRQEATARFDGQVLDELAQAQQRVNQATQDLRKAEQRTRQTALRAPVDGVVEGLQIHTIGGVVSPAQRLMTIVPDDRNLTVEVRLANRDVGFVHAGQTVKVKIGTFSFTRYGLIDGRVLAVSRDSVPHDLRDGTPPMEGEDASPAYTARIALDRTSMMVDGTDQPLQPGMAVTAEIRTGSRSILDYLLSPIARRSAESLHER